MSHSHSHQHHFQSHNQAFALGVGLNIGFVVVEATYGWLANSLALIADAGHNLSDVLGLLLAWGASYLATQKPSRTRTYGLRRSTIMASATSTLLLLLALGGICWEAFERLLNPTATQGLTVIVVATIGVAINTATAMLFMKDRKKDLNIRAAYLHMAADAGISAGVVVAGGIILLTGWNWLDPIISLLIVIVIFFGSWGLLKDSLSLSIDAVPDNIHLPDVERYFKSLKWVSGIHDLHIWALSTTESALTVHLVTDQTCENNKHLLEIQHHLHDEFDIEHSTIQIEQKDENFNCMLDKPECC